MEIPPNLHFFGTCAAGQRGRDGEETEDGQDDERSVQGGHDAIRIRRLFGRLCRHDEGDDGHAQGLAEVAR